MRCTQKRVEAGAGAVLEGPETTETLNVYDVWGQKKSTNLFEIDNDIVDLWNLT